MQKCRIADFLHFSLKMKLSRNAEKQTSNIKKIHKIIRILTNTDSKIEFYIKHLESTEKIDPH